MMLTELQTINQNRKQGETFNAAKERLMSERKLIQPPQRLLMPVKEEEPEWVKNDDSEEGFSSDDLIVPRYKIIQPTSRIEGATQGVFYNTLTHEEKPKLEKIVLLTRQNGRVLFPAGDFSGTRSCFSYDGLVPAREAVIKESGEEPKSPCCITKNNGQKVIHCPFAMWPDEATENGSRSPKCKESINFLCIDEFFGPFLLIFHGMGIPIVKNLIGTIYLKKKQAMLQRKELHLRSFFITIGLKFQVNERGKFYLPVFEKVEEIVEKERMHAIDKCFEDLNKRTFAEVIESEAAFDGQEEEVIETEAKKS